jgi:DNA-binding response OmpR family regulator
MRYNFSDAHFVVLDSYRQAARLTADMLAAFGAPEPYVLNQPKQTEALLHSGSVDAAVVTLSNDIEATLRMIRSVRAGAEGAGRFVPIIALTGYSDHRAVAMARDAGVNFVVRRPISPSVLFDRLVWVANTARPFVDSPAYCGPDRRFRDLGAPASGERRNNAKLKQTIVEI